MARLVAHGMEAVRLEKRTETPADEYASERREVVSIRTDGSVLRKRGAVVRPDRFNPQARLQWTSWKMLRTAKQARERGYTAEKWRERLLAMGFQIIPTARS